MSTVENMVESTYNKMAESLNPSGLESFKNWLGRVIEFAVEDEPKFTPNTNLIKELWEFGAPASGAADDCVADFNSK